MADHISESTTDPKQHKLALLIGLAIPTMIIVGGTMLVALLRIIAHYF